MAVANGQLANATSFNNAFLSRTIDTDTVGKMDLKNVDAVSGDNIINVQKNINALCSALGIPVNSVKDFLITWDDASTASVKDKLNELLGSIQVQFTLANNQVLTDIVGFIIDKDVHKSVEFTLEIERIGSSEYRQLLKAMAVYSGSAWSLEYGMYIGSDLAQLSLTSTEQVVLSIDSTTGQIKYATGNLTGHTGSKLKVFQTRMKV